MSKLELKTGDVVTVEIPNNIGCQQGGNRVAVIVSNNIGNRYSPVVEILPGTTKRNSKNLPTHAHFKAGECNLDADTVFEAESKWEVNKFQIKEVIGKMNEEQLLRVAIAMAYHVPLIGLAFDNGIQQDTTYKKIAAAQ